MSDTTDIAVILKNSIVKAFLPDNAQWKNRFEIPSSSSNRLYTVAQRKSDNTWGCSCPGWKRWRKCSHLTNLQPLLDKVTNSQKQLTNGTE